MTPRVFVQPRAMKGRLNKAPLAGMQRAVARQQPVAEEAPRAAQRSPFHEPLMAGDQHLLDVVGMIQKKDVKRAKPEVRDVAVLGADARQKRQRIAADLGQASQKQAGRAAQVETRKNLTLPRASRRAILAAMIAVVLNPSSGLTRRPRLREEIEELFRECRRRMRAFDELDESAGRSPPRYETRSTSIPRPSSPAAVMGRSAPLHLCLAGTPTPLGVLPLGTLNHFAKDAGIPLDLQKAVRDARRGPARGVSTSVA